MWRSAIVAACALAGTLASAGASRADLWLPHPKNAKWQYVWRDSAYNTSGTVENVDVQSQKGLTFTLAWADQNDQLAAPGQAPTCSSATADAGIISFQENGSGLYNTNWNSCPPPAQFPILCAVATNCANSIASTFFDVIWGSRSPLLSEPLLKGVTWNATGAAQNDVSSLSTVVGQQTVTVPAYPHGVRAEVVKTQITQAGAIGDPYGSGLRWTWWVPGVGPVKVRFDHQGGGPGSGPPPVTSAELLSTNLVARKPPADADYFPLRLNMTNRYRWTNRRHLPQPEVETVKVTQVASRSAALSVNSVSGPYRVSGSYVFTTRLDGTTNISGNATGGSLVAIPRLGHGRRFLTPLDLLVFGFNPVLPAYPKAGERWRSGNPTDFNTSGVRGWTRIVGLRWVRVPAGRFRALEVRSVLTQKGYPYGSGVRTCWFAPGRGLVKLVFQHRDRSTSVVQLIR